MPNEEGVHKSCEIRVFGVPHNRNRSVFAMDEVPDRFTDNARPLQHKLVVGCDTPVIIQTSKTPANFLGEFTSGWDDHIEKMFEEIDMMWNTLDPILKAN